MTNPVYTPQFCSVCGIQVGKRPGVEVIADLLCTNPLCHLQAPTSITERRDQIIFFAANLGIPVTSIARYATISRQRVYQIIEQEKASA